MNALIAYASRYESTEKCALMLGKALEGPKTVVNLKDVPYGLINLSSFDTVVIGGTVEAGRLPREIREFCAHNNGTITGKHIGLFICSRSGERDAAKLLEKAFPAELVRKALVKGYFGRDIADEKNAFRMRRLAHRIMRRGGQAYVFSKEKVLEFASMLRGGAV